MIDLNRIKGVIFDCDGVLVDTERWHWQSWVEILKPFNIDLSKNEYFNYSGIREEIIEADLIKKHLINVKKGELEKKKKDLMKEWVKTKNIILMPFAREAVQFFANKGLRMAVAGNAPRAENILKLKSANLNSYFSMLVAGDDVKRGKPYPDIYLLGCERLELKPEDCLAIEDAEYGLQAAKSAGLTCFVVPSEFSAKQDISKADMVFKNLKELTEFYKQNSK